MIFPFLSQIRGSGRPGGTCDMLDDKLKALWARISPPQKAAFFGCFLSGYLVHLYVFTNIIPNSDGLSRIFDPQQMTVSGRWFLHFASYFNGFTQMPAVIGLFSVLFLALSAAVPSPPCPGR